MFSFSIMCETFHSPIEYYSLLSSLPMQMIEMLLRLDAFISEHENR